MKQIVFDVNLTTKDLYTFTMRHTYCSVSGIFSLLISIGSLVACAVLFSSISDSTKLALLIIGLLFTVIQPILLYFKCRKQIRANKSINAPLQYILSEEGICVCQKEESVEVKWNEIRKVVSSQKGLYLYLSPIRAFIFPAEQCSENYEEIKEMVTEQIAKHRDDDRLENSKNTTNSSLDEEEENEE